MKKNGKAEPLDLHILIEKEDRLYSALCLELDVASQGRTVAEAKKNIVEAIELFLESVYALGDEKEFIPRPAPVEEWMKYFQAMTRRVNENFRRSLKRRSSINLREIIYAP
ncbi:MAG: type II toxin-antitoxin system HicB family antitoxin [bacterium]